jgi:hypothetical protein
MVGAFLFATQEMARKKGPHGCGGHGNKTSVRFKSTGERAMATWKRLTRENKPVDVNLDAVIYMQEHEGFTALHFAAYGGDRTQSISVSETPDEIHKLLALHSNE